MTIFQVFVYQFFVGLLGKPEKRKRNVNTYMKKPAATHGHTRQK